MKQSSRLTGHSPDDIEQYLPNGFHDAQILQISIDYVARTAEFSMKLDISGPDQSSRDYSSGKLRVNGFAFITADVPDERYDYAVGSLFVSGQESEARFFPKLAEFQKRLGTSFFFYTFFVQEWNGFIHISATDTEFEWDKNPQELSLNK